MMSRQVISQQVMSQAGGHDRTIRERLWPFPPSTSS